MRDYLAATRERIVVFDGSMGATLEQYDLTPADYGGLQGKCHEALILHRPDVIQALHESMIEAGAEVVQTDSFQASRLKLEEWGLGEHTLEINQKSAEIARKAVGEDKFVAGSIGPTGHLPASDDPTLGKITFRELVAVFEEQARGLVQGGADLIIIETAQDILEVKAAVFGARELCRVAVDLERVLTQAPLLELQARGLEGVGLDDLGTRLDHRLVDALDDVGPVEDERLVAAAREAVVALEVEVELLECGAHAAVEDDDAVTGRGEEVTHPEES